MWPFKKKCKHIWKTTETVGLDTISNMYNEGGRVEIDYYQQHAVYQTCLVCNESRIVQKNRKI